MTRRALTGVASTDEAERRLWEWRYGPRPEPMFPSTLPGDRGAVSPLGGVARPAQEKKDQR